MILLGIDPGGQGAMAAEWNGKRKICRFDKSTEQEVAKFLEDIADKASWGNVNLFAVIEKLHPMPAFLKGADGEPGSGMRGSISSFKVGQSYGFLRGLLTAYAIPYEEIPAKTWQKELACLSGGDKKKTRARAQQLWPELKVIHVIADALLLCEYARRLMIKRGLLK